MHNPDVKPEIIALLARHRQKATYGALADLTGGLPLGVMSSVRRLTTAGWLTIQL